MKFRVGIENNNEGRSIAWALEHPGCFAYGLDSDRALAAFPAAAESYAAWVALNGGDWLTTAAPVVTTHEESFDVWYTDASFERVPLGSGSMVESFFTHDWKPLSGADIRRALQLCSWTRRDLLAAIEGLSEEQRTQRRPGERWDINGILNHVAGAEWWYQERLGHAFPPREEDRPSDPLDRLELVRRSFVDLLPKLEGLDQVVGLQAEFWSPRKMLRRALWHERDHTEHIRKLA